VHQTMRTPRLVQAVLLAIALLVSSLATTAAARPADLKVFAGEELERGDHRVRGSVDSRPRAAFRKEPYLIFAGDPDAIEVHWQLQAAAPCTLDWGLDTDYSLGSVVTSEYGDDHQHAFAVTGLTASTPYFYRVRTGGVTRAGSFRSPPSADATSLKFFAYGDTRTYPAAHDSVAAAMVEAFTADPEFQTLTLLTGDLVSDGDDEQKWDDQFFDPGYTNIAALHANLPTEAARGNHEHEATLFAKYFPYPFIIGRAWSFDYGPAHFVVVDQYVDYTPGSAQLAWIEDDLATTDRPWRFMVLHEPGWSAGGHGNDTDVQDYLQPICVRQGVQMVFAGHNHYYARAVVEGVQHVTTGGGGAPLYTPDHEYPYLVAIAEEHHYCTIEIDGDSLRFAAVSCAGDTLDWFPRAASGVPDGPPEASALRLDAPAPCPSGAETALSFTLEESTHVELAVYDVRGRLVRSLLNADRPAGTYSATWDGKSDAGEPVASGVYFARLSGPRGSTTRRMVRIR
jgi:hypothetical protein